MTRLSRAEQGERNRERVLEAAEEVFIELGFHATSVEQVAERAGFTKGAVYSRFENKDDLFLAVLERRVDSRALAIEDSINPDTPLLDQAGEAGDAFFEVFLGQAGWSLLLMEFATYAARQDQIRGRFAERNRRLRTRMVELIDAHLAALGLTSPVPTAELATILFGLGSGLILERLVDPDAVPDDAFSDALGLLFSGVLASQPAAPAPPG